jgi:hypothetical protein
MNIFKKSKADTSPSCSGSWSATLGTLSVVREPTEYPLINFPLFTPLRPWLAVAALTVLSLDVLELAIISVGQGSTIA